MRHGFPHRHTVISLQNLTSNEHLSNYYKASPLVYGHAPAPGGGPWGGP